MKAPDYSKRIATLREDLKLYECDAFFSVDPADNAYLSGFFGSTSVVLITLDRAVLFCDFRYQEYAASLQSNLEVEIVSGSVTTKLGSFINACNLKCVAFDPSAITVQQYMMIEDELSAKMEPLVSLCKNIREIKDAYEISCIREASRLAEDALEQILLDLKCGICEYEVAAVLEYEFRKRGALRTSFESIVLFGERSSLPHGVPTDKPLEKGDIVLIDCGCVLDGYCSDLTMTFVFDRIPGKWFSDIYEYVRQAQAAAVETVCAGVPALAVDQVARDLITAAGHGDHFGHGTGHGVGLEVHEGPRLFNRSDAILETSMVVTMEPGIYLPGQGGVRIEDLLVVTDDGCDILTETPKELRIL